MGDDQDTPASKCSNCFADDGPDDTDCPECGFDLTQGSGTARELDSGGPPGPAH
jgi:hypothetical protein